MRFKNTIFVVSQSDTYIVSIQQILCSALSRGFEPCSAARELGYMHIGRVSATVQARLLDLRRVALQFLEARLEQRRFVLSCQDLL